MHLYQFSITAVKNNHKISDLKQLKFITLQLCKSEVKISLTELEPREGCVPSGCSREDSGSSFQSRQHPLAGGSLPPAAVWLSPSHAAIALVPSVPLPSSTFKDPCNYQCAQLHNPEKSPHLNMGWLATWTFTPLRHITEHSPGSWELALGDFSGAIFYPPQQLGRRSV